ncbi:hypothetical protein V2G26_007726 [Clonostachys chloroleuca]
MPSFLVIGAGVIGLSTTLELRARYPGSDLVIAAKCLPGDSAPDYTSAWGGANWFPAARENGPPEDWEAIGYRKLKELASMRPESGVQPMNIRWHYERPIDEVGIKTPETGKLWFEQLVGVLAKIDEEDLPERTSFGFEMASFVINVRRYLSRGYKLRRRGKGSTSIDISLGISRRLWTYTLKSMRSSIVQALEL